jgi:dTDP-4-dehydrorhamnose reductase
MAKTLWIPGAGGMLGSKLTAQARARGHTVHPTDRSTDIADASQVAAFLDAHPVDAIVNCAAYTAVDNAESEPDCARRINATGPAVLGRAAHARGCRVFSVSTDYVFAGDAPTDAQGKPRPWREDDPPGPASALGAYGASKLQGEMALLAETKGAGLVVRTAWLFGPGADGGPGVNFVATMLRLLLERETLRVVADQHGCPTSTTTLATALLDLLALPPETTRGVLHVTDSGPTTWHAFTSTIAAQMRARGLPVRCRTIEPITTADYPTPAPRPAWSVLDTTRATALLQRPLPPWTDTLAAHLDLLITRGALVPEPR